MYTHNLAIIKCPLMTVYFDPLHVFPLMTVYFDPLHVSTLMTVLLPPSSSSMSVIYQEHKDEDGFAYMAYSGENSMG